MNDTVTKPNSTDVGAMRTQQLAPREAQMPAVAPGFGSLQSFELMQRAAKLLSSSTLVPASYRQVTEKKRGQNVEYIENPNALANCVVALNMSQRMGADPLMVMQNLYIVEGRPSWSSQWIIAAINGCGRFSPLRFDLKDLGMQDVEYTVTEWVDGNRKNRNIKTTVRNMECVAWAIEKDTKERITSPTVSIEMAVKEGWFGKNGSKWQTMPEVMLRYRTASFFGKLYAPELLMGLQTVEEMQDIVIDVSPDSRGVFTADLDSLKTPTAPAAAKPQAGVDVESGEILTIQQQWEKYDQVLADYGPEEAENFMPKEPRPVADGAPTFDDAANAVKAGDFDMAREIARSLPEALQQQIETAIANRQKPEGGSTRRPRTGASIE